jgi:hypothetical protein
MRGKTRKIVDREVWGASPLRLAPPEDVKVTTQWSKKLGTKVRSSTAADEAYEFLIDLLGKDRIPNKKEKVIAEARARREARRRERDRNWRRARRRAGGMVAREIYECNSITKREPWKAFDWSRRTWERARQTGTRCRRCVVPYTCWHHSKTDLRHAAQAASPQSPPHGATAPSFRRRGHLLA